MIKITKFLLKNYLKTPPAKFFYGGMINYGLKIGLTILLTEIFKIWYLMSYAISLFTTIIFSFFYNAYITYQVKDNKKKNFLKYGFILGIFMFLDALFVKIMTEFIGTHYVFSIIIITTILFFIKYFVYNIFVFTKKTKFVNIAGNHYDKHNSKNPLVKILMNIFHDNIFSMIKKVKPTSMLDVGCGEGHTTKIIKNHYPFIDIKGCELEDEALQIAKKKDNNIEFIQGSIYELKWKKSSFDLVMASEVLEHLEKPNEAIKEVKRVTKKYCLFSVPNEPYWRIANIIRGAYIKDLGNTPGHIQHWNQNQFKNMLKKHFKNVKVKNSILWNLALCEK